MESLVTDRARAVLFDLGNTLVAYYRAPDFAPILRESVLRVCDFLAQRSLSCPDPEKAFRQALDLNVEDSTHRVRPLQRRLIEIFGAQTVQATPDLLSEMCRVFLEPIFRLAKLDVHALPTLAALRDRGIRTAIVSNTPWGSPSEPWAEELHRHGLTKAVDAVVFCVDVGWRKPAPAMFERALSLLSVEAQDAALVGDDPRQDIAGAERSGLRPILLDPAGASSKASCTTIRNLRDLLPLLKEGPGSLVLEQPR